MTVVCPLAESYITASARETCSATDGSATRRPKSAKYTCIETNYIFHPIAVESLDPINTSGRDFLSKLGRKLSTQSDDNRDQLDKHDVAGRTDISAVA